MLAAGKLNKRVTIQRPDEVRGAALKDVQRTWVTVIETWAAVEPIAGREYFQNQEVQAEIEVRVRIRYRTGIVPKMRVLYGPRIFEISSVIDPLEKHEQLELMCSEFRS